MLTNHTTAHPAYLYTKTRIKDTKSFDFPSIFHRKCVFCMASRYEKVVFFRIDLPQSIFYNRTISYR